jgi:Ser/Thr protein kinase RdoA (MazF antagonist)
MSEWLATVLRNPFSYLRSGTTHATIDPRHLARLVSDFDLGTVVAISSDQEGLFNRNFFLVTSTGKYFIKAFREEIKQHIMHIAAVEVFMLSRGIPAICMLPAVNGNKHVSYGSEVYSVYPFVESDRSHQYGKQEFKKMGAMLGLIHKKGLEEIPDLLSRKALNLRRSVPWILNVLNKYKKNIIRKGQLENIDLETLEYIDLKLELIPQVADPILIPCDTLVHGDFHQGNLFLDKNTREIIGICDWEKAEMAPRAYELAQSILHIHFRGKYNVEEALHNAKSYIEGYLSILPISRKSFEKGLKLRLQHLLMTHWIEDFLFRKRDYRVMEYVDMETNRLTALTKRNLAEKIILLFD